MSTDLSLSQSLGGLRIANPDDDAKSRTSASSPATSAPQFRPPQHSSLTPNGAGNALNLPPVDSTGGLDVASSLGYNPAAYAFHTNGSSPTTSPRPRSPSEPAYVHRKLSHRNSRGLVQQGQERAAPVSRYPGSASNTHTPRPPAGASTRGAYPMAARSPYPEYPEGSYGRVRGDTSQSEPAGVRRSSSRTAASAAAAAAMQGAASSRHPSGSRFNSATASAAYNQANFPPRQSSRPSGPIQSDSYHLTRAASQSDELPNPDATPPNAQEEWQERGAATAVRNVADKDGKPVSKVVKKGVKDFKFGRTLGEGSYSTVLAATDRSTNREYAIKVLDKRHIIKEKKVKYVNIEKDTLNRLTDHPGIVRLYYTFQDDKQLYFVLDLATGGELLGVLKKTTSFDEECSRFYGAQILDSVEYMHSRGIIHRDLKPENVLLDDQMHVKITDFGTAKILDIPHEGQNAQFGQVSVTNDPLDGSETDRAVSFVGTAEYVSPELLTNKNACKASDLWAFGCIIYQLLAGRPPFKAGNEYQTFQKIVNLDYSFPEGFPNSARDLVEKLLVLDPADRLPISGIKRHRFFEGMQWGKALWKQKPPRLRPHNPNAPPRSAQLHAASRQNSAPLNESTAPPPSHKTQSKPQPSTTPSSSSARPQPRVITELAPPSQLDIDWSPVLNKPNERILKLGNLVVTSAPAPHSPTSRGPPSAETPTETPSKFSRLFGASVSKKRERLVMISSAGRLILAPSGGGKKEAKQMVELRDGDVVCKSQQDPKGYTVWCILTVS